MLVHGVWNASAAGAGLSAIGESIGKPEWLLNYVPALLSGLLVMGFGMLAVLLASNRKLRNSIAQPPKEYVEKEEEVQYPA